MAVYLCFNTLMHVYIIKVLLFFLNIQTPTSTVAGRLLIRCIPDDRPATETFFAVGSEHGTKCFYGSNRNAG